MVPILKPAAKIFDFIFVSFLNHFSFTRKCFLTNKQLWLNIIYSYNKYKIKHISVKIPLYSSKSDTFLLYWWSKQHAILPWQAQAAVLKIDISLANKKPTATTYDFYMKICNL